MGFGAWMKKAVIKKGAAVLILAGAAAGLAIVAKLPDRQRPTPPKEQTLVNVSVQAIEPIVKGPGDKIDPRLRDSFELQGQVLPNRKVTVAAEATGSIIRMAERGQEVKAGDIIAQLDDSLLQAEVDRTSAQAEFDSRDVQKLTELVSKNAVGIRELDDARTRLKISTVALKTAKINLAHASILAPIDGVLDTRCVQKGDTIAAFGAAIGTLVDTKVVKVAVDVPARDIGYFKVADEQEVFCAMAGTDEQCTAEPLKGKITYIGQQADPKAHTTPIEISVANPDGVLRTGQPVTVRLTRRIVDKLIMVPLGALTPLESGYAVYVVEGVDPATNRGHAVERKVEHGMIRGWQAPILKGLEKGDLLIMPPANRYVADQQAVQIVTEVDEGGDASTKPAASQASRPSTAPVR